MTMECPLWGTPLSVKLTFPLCGTPQSAAQAADSSRVVEKSVNSVSAFGAKSSVHSLSPPFPTEPSRAAVSSFAALRMRHTPCGYCAGLRRGPILGSQWTRPSKSPLTGQPMDAPTKVAPERGDVGCADRGVLPPWQSVSLAKGYDFPSHSRSC